LEPAAAGGGDGPSVDAGEIGRVDAGEVERAVDNVIK